MRRMPTSRTNPSPVAPQSLFLEVFNDPTEEPQLPGGGDMSFVEQIQPQENERSLSRRPILDLSGNSLSTNGDEYGFGASFYGLSHRHPQQQQAKADFKNRSAPQSLFLEVFKDPEEEPQLPGDDDMTFVEVPIHLGDPTLNSESQFPLSGENETEGQFEQ
ncbi:hypothetical protein EMPS_04447 [Entomortierella parvispora]|uniref:Uncharacterized protein n=1 Tax=Entomortierella parvispora TaxID=205924 RepID=A0A9P3H8K6_9FUNG|nr:hypothetical protein EMPS_04447 [Entomortierella parvispora]